MLKGIVSALLIFRLELQRVPFDWGLVLVAWHQRPVIEILLGEDEPEEQRQERQRWGRKLDEVYPF